MIITLHRIGADGRHHFYTVHDRQSALVAPYALCASWRVGSGKERERLHCLATSAEKDALVRRIVAARLKDGYTVLYSFLRSGVSVGIAPSGGGRGSGGIPPSRGIESTA